MDREKSPPPDPWLPCEICGSVGHGSGHHDGAEPPAHHGSGAGSSPPDYATEPIFVDDDFIDEDDDRADS